MTETPPRIAFRNLTPPIEMRRPGYKWSLMEVTTSAPHVERVNILNNAIDPDEYAEAGPETSADTLAWLKRDNIRKFLDIHPKSSRRNLIGVGQTEHKPISEMIIGVSNEANELGGYVYVYDHESPTSDNNPAPEGVIRKEISFVTDMPDDKRNPDEMAEAMQQTAMMLWEFQAGKLVGQLDGTFTPEQLAQAKTLQIWTTAGRNENETNYVDGIIKAGFVQVGVYQEDGETQLVYTLDIDRLFRIMEVKKAAVSH